ncbi:MAG: YdcF family protein [Candidatus Thiodiazotropha sp. (ex Myrtea sp. 'scaly one' KF741663)]|nr:YdcF family protein [Candidatus Thiodiazotropha sp. (ex Myrtea sp. 'scaly one' KF741663)]
MDVTTTRLIESLLLPPGGLILLALLGLLLWRLKTGRRMLGFSLVLLWLLSLPAISDLLFLGLERHPPITTEQIKTEQPQAIVVLGAGRDLDAPEYAGDTVSQRMLSRLRYAARLARQTGLPVIPSGGNPGAIGTPEAKIARDILQNEYGVVVGEIETRSNTTWENARYTAQLMKQQGIERIILVTDACHMKRALYAFARNGIHPLPAPTNFLSVVSETITPIARYLPSGNAIKETTYAIHEYLGLLWYLQK